MAKALRLGIGFGADALDVFEKAPKRAGEGFVGVSRPKDDAAFRAQGGFDASDAWRGVEPLVDVLDKGIGTVVDVEQDCVIAVFAAAVDQVVNIADVDSRPRIIQQLAIYFVEKLPIPSDDFGQKFRDVDDGICPRHGEHPLEREAKTQTTDEDARPRRQMRTGKLRHLFFRRRGGGAHQLQARDFEEMVAVVLVEGERGAVGRFTSR